MPNSKLLRSIIYFPQHALAFVLTLAVFGSTIVDLSAALARAPARFELNPSVVSDQSQNQSQSTQILWNYRAAKSAANFKAQLATLPVDHRELLERILGGLYFIDYVHAAGDLLKLYSGEIKIEQTNFYDRYNEPGNAAFEKHAEGVQFLKTLEIPLSLEKVSALHRATLINYEDNLGPINPGIYRRRFVYGPEFENGLAYDTIAVINANPYLFYMKGTSIWGDTPAGEDQAEANGRVRGAIAYPRDRDIKARALERIRILSPDVYARVLDYKLQNGSNYWNLDPQLTQDLTQALLNERLVTLNKNLLHFNDLQSPEDLDLYIGVIARFQRDYISIHPFNDGNGRTSRLLLNYLCERQGLPIPRFIYPNEDIYSTPQQWTLKVKEGMLATARLEADLLLRMRLRERLTRSLEILTPLPLFGEVGQPEQERRFINFIDLNLKSDLDLPAAFAKDPIATIEKLKTEFLNIRH